MRYRVEGERLQRRLTLKPTYPTLSLADAREQARKVLRQAADGVDPAAQKQERREAGTFAELAAEYLRRHAQPVWGAPRIHDELGKVSVAVSERTVSRLLGRPRRPPSQTWRTFLTNHVATLVSIDFFAVPILTGRVLFVFIALRHHRRRVVHFNITEHPTAAAAWTAQQMIEAFPDDTAPRWLLRDRDAIRGDAFRRRVAGMGIGEVLASPSSPWQNPYAERLIGSIRRECLDHVIVLGERHLLRVHHAIEWM